MLKKLPAHMIAHVDVGGYDTNYYTVKNLPVGDTFEDILQASYWDNHKSKLLVMDRIRVRAEDGSFDVELTVTNKADNGEVTVELWPKYPAHVAVDRIATNTVAHKHDAEPSVVPLSKTDGEPLARVEFLEASKWRVRGHDGREVSRDHPNKTEAEKALAKYLKQMNLVMPSEDAIKAAKEAIEKAKAERAEADKAPKAKGKAA